MRDEARRGETRLCSDFKVSPCSLVGPRLSGSSMTLRLSRSGETHLNTSVRDESGRKEKKRGGGGGGGEQTD